MDVVDHGLDGAIEPLALLLGGPVEILQEGMALLGELVPGQRQDQDQQRDGDDREQQHVMACQAPGMLHHHRPALPRRRRLEAGRRTRDMVRHGHAAAPIVKSKGGAARGTASGDRLPAGGAALASCPS
jgi:hypothetical protein